MRDINKVILVGRLGTNPILRYTKTGIPVTHLSVATSRRVLAKGATAETEETQWHQVVIWGSQGKLSAESLSKGSSVFIEGFIKSHRYEAKDKSVKTRYEVQAETVIFLERRRTAEENPDKVSETPEETQGQSDRETYEKPPEFIPEVNLPFA